MLLAGSEGAYFRANKILSFELILHPYELAARANLAAKFLRGTGIEIGALQRGLTLPSYCTVRYVDRMPLDELRRHYPELAGIPMQAPDLIDDGELLLHLADASQDFVIANHFFEHSRNSIQTLWNLARVLAPGGILFMAVPDRRYTKDIQRPETEYADLLDAYRTGVRQYENELFREWAGSWENARGASIESKAKELQQREYSIHFNVWSLSRLLEFLIAAKKDAHMPFDVTCVVSSENENILVLSKH